MRMKDVVSQSNDSPLSEATTVDFQFLDPGSLLLVHQFPHPYQTLGSSGLRRRGPIAVLGAQDELMREGARLLSVKILAGLGDLGGVDDARGIARLGGRALDAAVDGQI